MLADVSIATGWCTIALMLLGKFVFQYLGWSAAASATPAIMLATGAGFFGLSLAANQGVSVAGMDPAAMAVAGVLAGAVTQVWESVLLLLGTIMSLLLRASGSSCCSGTRSPALPAPLPTSTRPLSAAGVCPLLQVLAV